MRRLVLLPLALAATPAHAQEADIVVTGRGLANAPGDRALGVVEIDRERIEANAAARLESVLGEVAGLQQFRRSDSRSANPTSQGITLRGLGGNAASRALLIVDGVPQADPFGGWVAFPAYATDRIGRIRVTRGGGSGVFGAGALAGTIEIDSAVPITTLAARAAYGSRDAVDLSATSALVRPGGVATLSAAYARGDGFIPIIAGQRGAVDRPAPYEQASVGARGVIAVGDETELQANLLAFTDRRERGTPFSGNLSEGADASVRIVRHGRWGISALGYVQTRGFESDFAAIDAARATATQTLDQFATPATGVGGRIEVSPPIGEGATLRIGGDIRALMGETNERFTFVAAAPTRLREAGGTTRTTGLFADASLERGPVTFALGGRFDWWRITDGRLIERPIAPGAPLADTRFADRDGSEATGRAGVAWRVAAPVLLRAAAYRGWRLPTLNELYRPFRVGADAVAANAALSPERLDGVEAGITAGPVAGATVSATVFANRLEDGIANVTVARGPGTFPGVGFVSAAGSYRVRQNLDAIRTRGWEVDAGWRGGDVGARVSWSHVRARVAADGNAAALDGLRPAQTPSDQLSVTLDWRREGAAAAATLHHVSAQFEDDANERALAAATTLDLYAALPITPSLAIEAGAENVGDARVEAGVSGAGIIERATPRTIWIGLRLRG